MSENKIKNIREKNNLNIENDLENNNFEDKIKDLENILKKNIEKNKNMQLSKKENQNNKLQITNNINNTTDKLIKIQLLSDKIKNVSENNLNIQNELNELKKELEILENQNNLKIEELNECLKDIYLYLDKNRSI